MAKEGFSCKPSDASALKVLVVGPDWDIEGQGESEKICVIRVALPDAFHRFRDRCCVVCPPDDGYGQSTYRKKYQVFREALLSRQKAAYSSTSAMIGSTVRISSI